LPTAPCRSDQQMLGLQQQKPHKQHYACKLQPSLCTLGPQYFTLPGAHSLQPSQKLRSLTQSLPLHPCLPPLSCRLCELNVLRQVFHVATSPVVASAWSEGQELHLYGIIYDVADGHLKRLAGPISSDDGGLECGRQQGKRM
jgi:carbonic anhydrase